MKISSQIKLLCLKIILTYENVSKGSHYFPRIKEISNLNKVARFAIKFGLPPLHTQNTWSRLFWGFKTYVQNFCGFFKDFLNDEKIMF